MTVFDTAIYDPEPSDRDLVMMYRAFSQEMWFAGWMSSPEDMADDFVKWLREDYAEYRSLLEEWRPLDFEVAALPTLRSLYAEAFGATPLEERPAGVIVSRYSNSQKLEIPGAVEITVTEDALTAQLSDGRTISVPLSWYPRLVHATPEERNNWRLIGTGQGIHWPDLDEDISVEGLLAGWPSRESQKSLKQWIEAKKEGRGLTLYELRAYEKERQRATDG